MQVFIFLHTCIYNNTQHLFFFSLLKATFLLGSLKVYSDYYANTLLYNAPLSVASGITTIDLGRTGIYTVYLYTLFDLEVTLMHRYSNTGAGSSAVQLSSGFPIALALPFDISNSQCVVELLVTQGSATTLGHTFIFKTRN